MICNYPILRLSPANRHSTSALYRSHSVR